MKNLALFASGGGSNAEAIINHFKNHKDINVSLIVSNKPEAYVLERAKKHGIPTLLCTKSEIQASSFLKKLQANKVDFIALAGFLLLIPEYLIAAYDNKIVNIHPSLLPKYGGKGMYGSRVHQAVFNNLEKTSGLTVHYVNGAYDEGNIIFQAETSLEVTDTPDRIAQKVLKLEHEHYGRVIEEVMTLDI